MAFLGNTTTIVTPDLMITITFTTQQSLLFHFPATPPQKIPLSQKFEDHIEEFKRKQYKIHYFYIITSI